MKTYRIILFFLVLMPAMVFAQTQSIPIRVFVSILPIKYFVERVGGNNVDVSVMVRPGQSPETYAPTPQQMVGLSKAKIYYRIGVPFEDAWMKRIRRMNPSMQIVDLRKGITLRHLPVGIDPHIWTNPLLVVRMSETIRDSLINIDTKNSRVYEKNYSIFVNDLKKLDNYIRVKLKNLSSRTFLVFHPAWGYFADAYRLEQIAIEQEGKEAGPRDLENIAKIAKQKQIKVVFVQPQFNKTQAQAVANLIHAKIVVIDPLAENYLSNMYKVTDIFARYLNFKG
jgi:zinc transport system substrate-binding protein